MGGNICIVDDGKGWVFVKRGLEDVGLAPPLCRQIADATEVTAGCGLRRSAREGRIKIRTLT